MILQDLRREYHGKIYEQIIRSPKGYPNFADGSNRSSKAIAWGIVKRLGSDVFQDQVLEQTAGDRFEKLTSWFIQESFELLQHLRPGDWCYSTERTGISAFEQYEHLAYLKKLIAEDKTLASTLGGDYIINPDIVIGRYPVDDSRINFDKALIDKADDFAKYTPLRKANRNEQHAILHASISCKWTIRSDRSQNTRTEALNLIRNRKGPLPHIMAITAEPLPTRIASLALGTGDLDCVYHFALPELFEAIIEIDNSDQLDLLSSMVDGRRLRDISDLPFDLAI